MVWARGFFPSLKGPAWSIHLSSPAPPVIPVAFWGSSPNGAPPGTVAAFAASQWVEAEGMGLTHLTLGPDHAGRAEALPCHLLTEAPATVARWPGDKETA